VHTTTWCSPIETRGAIAQARLCNEAAEISRHGALSKQPTTGTVTSIQDDPSLLVLSVASHQLLHALTDPSCIIRSGTIRHHASPSPHHASSHQPSASTCILQASAMPGPFKPPAATGDSTAQPDAATGGAPVSHGAVTLSAHPLIMYKNPAKPAYVVEMIQTTRHVNCKQHSAGSPSAASTVAQSLSGT